MNSSASRVDAVVIGAGFAGLYAVHRLRDTLGLRVQGLEAGSGPGGTWYWNRYPGARCDIESVNYSYSFSEELQQEWRWSERFAAQPEILAYLEHVADRFDLRRDFRFDARVTSTVWDDASGTWAVTTEGGSTYTARFVLGAVGALSTPKTLEFPGLETFAGPVLSTHDWPREPVSLAGKRVGVIGTGSSGIQVIPKLAEEAAHLTVFQRTPNFAAPLCNRPTDPDEEQRVKASYAELRAQSRAAFLGCPYEPPAAPSALMDTPERRREVYDRYYDTGGFRLVVSTYGDLIFNEQSNATISDYLRERIRDRVEDPEVAELLCPTDHPYATKRAPFETNYFETFNRPNVELVNLRAAPIQEVTERGVRTADGEHELDVLVLATGFDAFTGSLTNLGIVGRDGLDLRDAWADGPHTYLGFMAPGFPNLFTITGPQSPISLYNNPLAIEDHVELAADAIKALLDAGQSTLEVTPEAAERWGEVVAGVADQTLLPRANSWYMGANVEGKPRQCMLFIGGAPLYRLLCDVVVGSGWAGFARDGAGTDVPDMLRLDPAVLFVVGGMLAQGAPPLEDLSVEETRELLETFVGLQLPPPDVTTVVKTTYPGSGGPQPATVYVPDGEAPLPVVLYLHPGGWIGGSTNIVDSACRMLATDLGAVVVAAGYRLAPEHPFPAAIDDVTAALHWVADTVAEHGGDPARIAIAGESAGGNLAAAAALRARDEGGPALVAQALITPPMDPRAQTPSREQWAQAPILTVAALDGMWAAYLGDPANADSPLAAPGRAASLEGLPPALVITVEADPSRDEAEAYGAALAAAGVPTEVRRFDGLVHATYSMSAVVPRAAEIHTALVGFLGTRLARGGAADASPATAV
ncbi:MAG: putative flavoprotein involved in transport [Solirubrobacterales bacterium]|nr:putative flavoprotein involved in transport [Solirubrobacterales bacterium]